MNVVRSNIETLTNGLVLKLERTPFSLRFAYTKLPKRKIYVLTREGLPKSAMAEYRDKKNATSRFMVAAILLNSEAVNNAIRREIRRVSDRMIPEEKGLKEKGVRSNIETR